MMLGHWVIKLIN